MKIVMTRSLSSECQAVGALGTVKKGLDQNRQLLPGYRSATELQKVKLRTDSQYTSRFRSVTVPSPFRQIDLCSHCLSCRGLFRPRQTRQLPRAVDLKGRLLSCQSY